LRLAIGLLRPEETFLPGINGHPVSGSHPHQSNGEVHYLLHTQAGLFDQWVSIPRENQAVKIFFLIFL
jgi:hypothetical protein